MLLRRTDFLKSASAAALAGGAGLALASTYGCSGTVGVVPAPAPAPTVPWAQLAAKLSGRLLRPGQTGFERYARPENLRYAAVMPAGIALCADAADVAASILWARENGIALVARSGGHSYAGYSTTTGLLIDVTLMRSFSFDPSSGVATLGGGARNADVFARLRKYGVAITHGRCFSVGVAGLVLGGGVGFNMREHGVTCDQLVATDIVTADGMTHTIGRSVDDKGLFWACRGAGGGNYGINTSLSFQTFPVGSITVYKLHWTIAQQAVFAALLDAIDAAPDAMGCKLSATVSGASNAVDVELIGQLVAGTPADLHDILAPVYALAMPSSGFVKETGYWEGQDLITEVAHPAYFQERSRFFDVAFGNRAVATVFSHLQAWPGLANSSSFKLFRTGGRVNAVAPNATAFVHRTSQWLSSIDLYWNAATSADDLARSLDWQSAFYHDVAPLAKGGAYQNFIDPSLTDWKSAYYGDNLSRLEAIKKRVDPQRVFSFAEAIS